MQPWTRCFEFVKKGFMHVSCCRNSKKLFRFKIILQTGIAVIPFPGWGQTYRTPYKRKPGVYTLQTTTSSKCEAHRREAAVRVHIMNMEWNMGDWMLTQ